MAFYDSVKDDIRKEKGDLEEGEDAEDDNVGFDQLKKEAEDREDPDEKEGSSDTEIEVVGQDDLSAGGEQETDGGPAADGGSGSGAEEQGAEPTQEPRQEQESRPEPDGGTVEILQRIERQNEEMLDVLRGIKRSLE